MRISRTASSLLFVVLGATIGACSGTAATPATGTPAGTVAPTTAATEAPPTTAATEAPPTTAATEAPPTTGAATVNIGDTSLGKVLVDDAGLTLYIFTADGAGTSVCEGDCLVNWPALGSTGSPTLGAGLDAAAFTLITRSDGSSQVAIKGMPLYYFAGDKAAADVNGQGLNGKWYVVGGDGTIIK